MERPKVRRPKTGVRRQKPPSIQTPFANADGVSFYIAPMAYQILHTDSGLPDFIALVQLLDAELAERDGEEHSFYAQFNGISHIRHAIVLYENEEPVACGAFKPFDTQTVEIKRMYTKPAMRGKGVAAQVLQALEQWASSLGYQQAVLETGIRQPEAIALYKKCGYQIIPNYGQYAGIANSVCFSKPLTQPL